MFETPSARLAVAGFGYFLGRQGPITLGEMVLCVPRVTKGTLKLSLSLEAQPAGEGGGRGGGGAGEGSASLFGKTCTLSEAWAGPAACSGRGRPGHEGSRV